MLMGVLGKRAAAGVAGLAETTELATVTAEAGVAGHAAMELRAELGAELAIELGAGLVGLASNVSCSRGTVEKL